MREFMSAEYVIRLEDPRQDDVVRMLSALDRCLQSLMYVTPEARGRRLGRAILARIEEQAARALYRSEGYAERVPFGEYRPDPLSVFMEKRLVTR
jgi:GNAT superfamily N-acetyltransferase